MAENLHYYKFNKLLSNFNMQNYNLNQFSQKLNEFSAEIFKYEEFLNNFPKCKNLNVLKEIVLLSKKSNKKISFISGNFNVIHPGHLRLLKFAKEISDILIVYINPDQLNHSPVLRNFRMESMQALNLVDYLVNDESTLVEVIKSLKPDLIVKGKEFENKFNIEKKIIDNYGGKLYFSSGEFSYSSYKFFDDQITKNTKIYAEDYLLRHKISLNKFNSVVEIFNEIKSLVIGDLIIDQYILCDPLGMSQEDPTIVVSPNETKEFIGGAGIVAKHIENLGSKTNFCTVVGLDEEAKKGEKWLKETNINFNLIPDETRPTTTKKRYQSKGKTLLRVNQLRQHSISESLITQLEKYVVENSKDKDLIIFSDFNYGCLPQKLVNKITQYSKNNNLMVVADSQSSSQVGDISRFKNTLLITPTEHEARIALKDFENGLPIIAEKLHKKTNVKYIAITLAADGLFVSNYNNGNFVSDKLPAFTTKAIDPSGAGDCFFAITSLCLACGCSFWESAYLGSICAGIQVSKLGNQAISKKEILSVLDKNKI